MEFWFLCVFILFEICELSYLLWIPAELQPEGGRPQLLQTRTMAQVSEWLIYSLDMIDMDRYDVCMFGQTHKGCGVDGEGY